MNWLFGPPEMPRDTTPIWHVMTPSPAQGATELRELAQAYAALQPLTNTKAGKIQERILARMAAILDALEAGPPDGK